MNTFITVLLLSISLAVAVARAPLYNANLAQSIPDQYIVVLQKNLTVEHRDAHIARVLSENPVKLAHRYHINTFIGYSAVMSKEALEAELAHPNVLYIEQDQVVTSNADATITQTGATWGIGRVSRRSVSTGAPYLYWESAGRGVDVYIIDTGIYVAHNEFAGRAKWGVNYIDARNEDCNGHGTHVASTVGGAIYGVAKNVNLIAVKVLDCGGSGTYAAVIAGIDYSTSSHSKGRRSVANMSLGGGASQAVDDAVSASVREGVTHVIAAGNSADNACYYSPARTPDAITVAASTATDGRASFSNHGNCVDIYAPGNAVVAGYIGSPTAIATLSGTSMASPHVAGGAALYLGHYLTLDPVYEPSPQDVLEYLQAHGTPSVITGNPTGTPNLLLYTVHSA